MRIDILPQARYNSWTVLNRVPSKPGTLRYLCRCDCGNERELDKYVLVHGRSKTCGECPYIPPQSVFGQWTVLHRSTKTPGVTRYRCKCACGAEKDVDKRGLLSGSSTSCGHYEKLLPETKLNRWTVLGEAPPKGKNKQDAYFCRCDCGTERVISRYELTTGRSKSCGCLQKEVAKEVVVQRCTTHGMSKSNTYKIWATMVQRCTNPNSTKYADYGGRGITVCERWRNSFSDFLADMGERPDGLSIERLDNYKGYNPENCVWADSFTQARNTRRTGRVTVNDKTKSITDWSKETGISSTLIRLRLDRGRPPARALNML